MTIFTRAEMAGRTLVRKYFPRTAKNSNYDPYDKQALEKHAGKLLKTMHAEGRKSPVEACQRLLKIMEDSYPTPELAAEYFHNLGVVLAEKPRLERPGQIVIGVGPGRCGSTSLSAMLGTVANSCSTHETPPPIFWDPQPEQIDFHIARLRMLSEYHLLVCDVSHWWLNAVDQVFDYFPDARVIGLLRDRDDCALSFARIQGVGKGSFNPWAPRGNGVWRAGSWDATYPSYPLPSDALENPDRAKLELITRYVQDYNTQLETLSLNSPDRVKLVRTDDLSLSSVQEQIFQIAKAPGEISDWKLNVMSTSDGKKNQIRV